MIDKRVNKWKSRRWLVTIWAMFVVSGIVLASMLRNYSPEWIGISLPLLIAIPSVFIASETYIKPKMSQNSETEETK